MALACTCWNERRTDRFDGGRETEVCPRIIAGGSALHGHCRPRLVVVVQVLT